MKLLTICFLALTTVVAAQNTETRKPDQPFNKVHASNNITMVLVPSAENKIEIDSKNVPLADIITTVANGELKASISGISSSRDADIRITVYTSAPVTRIASSFGGLVKNDLPLIVPSMEIDAASDGFINVVVEAGQLTVSGGKGSDIYIDGTFKDVMIEAIVGSKIHMDSAKCTNVTVKCTLGSKVWISAENDFKVKTGPGGKVYYRREPSGTFEKSMVSGGQIIRE